MVETGLLAGQLGSALQQGPQSLPAANMKDTERFQDLVSGTKSDTSIQPQSLDNSVLQFVEPGQQVESGTLVDKMISQASKIDGSYHSLLEQMGNRPGFDAYLNKTQDGGASTEMMTYPHVENSQETSNVYEESLQSMKDVNSATLAYQSDMNTWAMNFKIWSSSVEIVASAAKRVSTGFQTLFRASG